MTARALPLVLALFALSTLLIAAAPKKKAPRVTAMTFSTSGLLLVGWSDGRMGTINLTKKRGKTKRLDKKKRAIVAIAPNAKSAVLDASPAMVIETKKGLHLAEVSKVDKMEDAVYTPDGSHLIISGQDRMMIWKDAENLHKLGKKGIRLEEFVARQNGDVVARLGEMNAQMAIRDGGPYVLFADKEGLLTYWDMRNTNEASFIAKIDPPHAVRTMHRDFALVASEADHKLHVFHYSGGKKATWDMKVQAEDAVSTPYGVVTLYKGALELHDTDTGSVLWETTIDADGEPCGLVYGLKKPKKKTEPRLAVCHGSTITVHHAESGEMLSKFVRKKTKISSKKIKKKKSKK